MTLINNILSNKGNKTVFSLSEISSLTGQYSGQKLYSALKYAVKTSSIIRVSRGIYALNNSYNKQEFANKYRSPSYISLYTILQGAGIVFQPYDSIYAVSNRCEEATVDGQKYIYRKIKDEFLLNPIGLTTKNGVNKATSERAICDKIYLDGDEYFDNLRQIDWVLMKTINQKVYRNNTNINEFIRKNKK
jgi:hypothetical protein